MHQLEAACNIEELNPIIKAIITKHINPRPKNKDNRIRKETHRKITIFDKQIKIAMRIDEKIKKLER